MILALLGAACAAPTFVVPYTGAVVGAPYAHAVAPVSYASQHHAQDELGQVNYGFAHAGQAKNEVRDAFGNVAGAYSYVDADGKPVVVEYTAGVNGFQVKSNNLPVGPGVPEAVAVAGPEPVEDTPEVAAARADFQAAFDAAAAGSLAADAPAPVADTPEVTAAKLEFLQAYNAAAAAAAAAPDDEEEVMAEAAEAVTEAAEAVTEAEVEAAEEATDAPAEAAEEVPAEEVEAEETAEEAAPLVAPEPVMDTEEVALAKAEFEAAFAAAAAAAAADEVMVPEGAPEAVMDTAEVAAAKAEFQASFDAAAAAADAAPDFDLDGSVSRYSGYLSAVDGSLSPYYTNTLPFGAYGVHAVAAPVAAPVAYHGVGYTPFVAA